jgi:hypothetical protein
MNALDGEAAVVDRLMALRGPGESMSDVILRLVELEAKGARGNGPPVVRKPRGDG